jgi:hypothetical protein
MELDLKSWDFLVYPGDYDEQENTFDHLIMHILLEGIIPLTSTYFVGFFLAHGIAHRVYCQCHTDFVKE